MVCRIGEYSLENYFPSESQAVELLPKTNSIFINARSYIVQKELELIVMMVE